MQIDPKLNHDKLLAMRHSTEHVLTQAMLKLYPNLKMAMGPATEDGFYFDFDYDKKISEDDFPKIEAEMKKIISNNLPFKKRSTSRSKSPKTLQGKRIQTRVAR